MAYLAHVFIVVAIENDDFDDLGASSEKFGYITRKNVMLKLVAICLDCILLCLSIKCD